MAKKFDPKEGPLVSIILLNWNGWEDTIECLESVYQINYQNYDIIIVDNASTDDSINKIREYCDGNLKVNSSFFEYSSVNKPIEFFECTEESKRSKEYNYPKKSLSNLFLIKNNLNSGFAGGNNIGINYAIEIFDPDYILLLNNDTVVNKDFLNEMIFYAENNQKVGIIGPKICYYDIPNKIQVTQTKIDLWSGRNFLIGDGEIDQGQYDEIQITDYVPGSCFLIKRKVLNKVGLLNEEFYCYWEESDYCMSTKKFGYDCIYYPNSKIWHKVSKSTNKLKGILTYYMTRNMFWFMKRHATNVQYIVFLIFYGLKFWYILIHFLHKKQYKNVLFFFKGIKDGIFSKSTF